MRVLVASGPLSALDADTASGVIAAAFHAAGAEVAVVSLMPAWPAPRTLDELAEVLAGGAHTVDLTAMQFEYAQTRAASDAIAGHSFVAVVRDSDVSVPLTGLSGSAVQRSREHGDDLAAGLAVDAAAQSWLATHGFDDAPGAGAVNGLGAVLIHHGIRLTDTLTLAMERSDVATTAAQADLLVTGCTDLDFHTRGGPIVERMAQVAEQALRPVIVICGRNYISSRELRIAGIESAYPVRPGDDPQPVDRHALAAHAARVARTWRW